jgi:hypothetical protein
MMMKKEVDMAPAKGDSIDELMLVNMNASATPAPAYKVYKRRFLGLFQLVLLNIIISWDVGAFFCPLALPLTDINII